MRQIQQCAGCQAITHSRFATYQYSLQSFQLRAITREQLLILRVDVISRVLDHAPVIWRHSAPEPGQRMKPQVLRITGWARASLTLATIGRVGRLGEHLNTTVRCSAG